MNYLLSVICSKKMTSKSRSTVQVGYGACLVDSGNVGKGRFRGAREPMSVSLDDRLTLVVNRGSLLIRRIVECE